MEDDHKCHIVVKSISKDFKADLFCLECFSSEIKKSSKTFILKSLTAEFFKNLTHSFTKTCQACSQSVIFFKIRLFHKSNIVYFQLSSIF